MKKLVYLKPEVRALKIQQSGVVCGSNNEVTNVDGSDDIGYGGAGGDNPAQAHSGSWADWEEDFSEDFKSPGDPKPKFNQEAFLSVLR